MQFRLSIAPLMFACVAAVIPAMAGSAAAADATAKGITVSHAWARATPGGSTVGAAYLEIKAADDTSDRLVGVSSPVAESAEFHSTVTENGVMKMRQLADVALKPGESHTFQPSGDHIMLLKLKQPLVQGESVKLTLTFEKAGSIEIEAPVESIGAMGPQ